MGHGKIEHEARQVANKLIEKRDVLKNPAPEITLDMLVGIESNGRVSGYSYGKFHRGTFYAECEGVTYYRDESFLRVIMFGDEFHDRETRIPIETLRKAGFVYVADRANAEGEKS